MKNERKNGVLLNRNKLVQKNLDLSEVEQGEVPVMTCLGIHCYHALRGAKKQTLTFFRVRDFDDFLIVFSYFFKIFGR